MLSILKHNERHANWDINEMTFSPLRWENVYACNKAGSWVREDRGIPCFSDCWWEGKLEQPLPRAKWPYLSEFKDPFSLTWDSSAWNLLWHIPTEPQGCLFKDVHSSIVGSGKRNGDKPNVFWYRTREINKQ